MFPHCRSHLQGQAAKKSPHNSARVPGTISATRTAPLQNAPYYEIEVDPRTWTGRLREVLLQTRETREQDTRGNRREYSLGFVAKVATETFKVKETPVSIARRFEVHPDLGTGPWCCPTLYERWTPAPVRVIWPRTALRSAYTDDLSANIGDR